MKTRDFKSGIENISEYSKSTVGKLVKLSINDQVMIQKLLHQSNVIMSKLTENSEEDTTQIKILFQFLDNISTLKTESINDFLSKFIDPVVAPGKIDLNEKKEDIISKF